MNIGERWQAGWRGPEIFNRWWWREWWNIAALPWLLQNFRWNQRWPSKGFDPLYRFWRIGWLELRRFERTKEESRKLNYEEMHHDCECMKEAK